MFDESLARVVRPLSGLVESFVSSGHRLYLVGGIVRDLFLGLEDSDDIDLTTDALPEDIRVLLEKHASVVWLQGQRFGTVGGVVNGRSVEITTHRSEVYSDETRKPEVQFGKSVLADLERRDFTCNAMAVSLPALELVDPHGGRLALENKVLETPLPAVVSFSEDPLRMFRAARFVSRFGLIPTEALLEAAKSLSGRINVVSVERIRGEFERLLVVADPKKGLQFLLSCNLHGSALFGSSWSESTGEKEEAFSRSVVLASSPADGFVRRCAFLWPFGMEVAKSFCQYLKYSKKEIGLTLAFLRVAEQIAVFVESDGGEGQRLEPLVRRVVFDLGYEHMELLRQFVGLLESEQYFSSDFFDVFDAVDVSEGLEDMSLPVSGGEIMAYLGITGGPLVGEVLDFLKEKYFTLGSFSQKDAFIFIDVWRHSSSR